MTRRAIALARTSAWRRMVETKVVNLERVEGWLVVVVVVGGFLALVSVWVDV